MGMEEEKMLSAILVILAMVFLQGDSDGSKRVGVVFVFAAIISFFISGETSLVDWFCRTAFSVYGMVVAIPLLLVGSAIARIFGRK